MIAHVITTGAALLLLAALPTGARADDVTWSRCKEAGGGWGWERVLGSGPDYNATLLNLIRCFISTLHLDTFNGLPNLTSIRLSKNNIEHINTSVFISVPNLTYLNLNDNDLREVPNFGEYSVLPHLTGLYIENNHIVSLSNPNTFSSCGQLKRLELSNNNIEYILPDFFISLKSLEYLYLNNNKLRMVTSSIFGIKTLNVLNLSHNSIEYVHPRAFRGSKLEELHLENNRLAFLPFNFASELIRAGANLEIFHFYNNPWHCACLLEHLADVKRAGVPWRDYSWAGQHYEGARPECVFTGRYPCLRRAPSALLPPPPPPRG